MKNICRASTPFLSLFLAILTVAFVAALVCVSAPVALAQAATDAAPVVVAAPWYADGAFIGGLIAALMSIVAIWQNKEKQTAQKVSESLVQAIEVATKIPEVAAKEKAIKAKINETVTQLGVQPLVHRIVKDVTL